MKAIYDDIGTGYSVTRCTDPQIAAQLYPELAGAGRILNIGAGTGSYEPDNVDLIAVEPSAEMIAQRKPGAYPVEQAYAEQLPFAGNSFSHVMTILSMHHWQDKAKAFREINRVATDTFIAITWDPQAEPFWLTRDYFPDIHKQDQAIFPCIDGLKDYFDDVQVKPLLIPALCQDGFFAAFWKRPAAYLDPDVRRATSPLAKLPESDVRLQRLADDLASGEWKRRNQALLNLYGLDVGYRLVTARIRQ